MSRGSSRCCARGSISTPPGPSSPSSARPLHEAGHLAMLLWLRQRYIVSASACRARCCGRGRCATGTSCSPPRPAMNLALLLAFSHAAALLRWSISACWPYNLLPFYPLDGGRLLRAVLRTLLPLRAAVWAERGVCLLCGRAPVGMRRISDALLARRAMACWCVPAACRLRCCRNEEIDRFILTNSARHGRIIELNDSERCPSGLRSRS